MTYIPARIIPWEQHIHKWRMSGRTAADWCREHRLVYSTFLYWKYKVEGGSLQQCHEASLKASSFVELSDASCGHSGIELVASGVTIRLSRQFDEQTLKSALKVVGSL